MLVLLITFTALVVSSLVALVAGGTIDSGLIVGLMAIAVVAIIVIFIINAKSKEKVVSVKKGGK